MISRVRTFLLRLLRLLGRAAFLLSWLWCIGALWFLGPDPSWVRMGLALSFAILVPLLWWRLRSWRRCVAGGFVSLLVVLIMVCGSQRASNERPWTADLATLPEITVGESRVQIRNLRDCTYRTEDEYELRLREESYELSSLTSVDFLVERFHAYDFLAHTLLSFGFEDGRHVAISVELRREEGESFHPIAGIYNQYEIMYVVGTESDLIGLRTNFRKSRVWLYAIRTTPERMRALFLDMLRRAQGLSDRPEFYNSLTNSCTTNIVNHVRMLVPGRIPLDWRVILPGYAGELALELDLIETDLPTDEALAAFRIDPVAQEGPVDETFSRRIRSVRPKAR